MEEQVVDDVQPTWKVVHSIAPEAASFFMQTCLKLIPHSSHSLKGIWTIKEKS
ncbi:hypothetical protein [Marinobacterium rhizophilum]|uniref:hypothetical protein n=1 Tax=Marinobacterium rhizophilum TaxID=420402 RepID=UPI0003665FB9|nr:hypothetical protein [Marinobacterium rhizophilum]